MRTILFISLFFIACQPKAEVDPNKQALLENYFKFQKALSKDNIEQTGQYIEAMKTALVNLDVESNQEWLNASEKLAGTLSKYDNVAEMAKQRELFQELSDAIAGVVTQLGYHQDIYVMKCPMAFNDTGATWLQDDKMLVNPYFGSQMYRCGSQAAVIAAKE